MRQRPTVQARMPRWPRLGSNPKHMRLPTLRPLSSNWIGPGGVVGLGCGHGAETEKQRRQEMGESGQGVI